LQYACIAATACTSAWSCVCQGHFAALMSWVSQGCSCARLRAAGTASRPTRSDPSAASAHALVDSSKGVLCMEVHAAAHVHRVKVTHTYLPVLGCTSVHAACLAHTEHTLLVPAEQSSAVQPMTLSAYLPALRRYAAVRGSCKQQKDTDSCARAMTMFAVLKNHCRSARLLLAAAV
jgi:hypothetical protein